MKENGFTLIELMVTIAIMGILSTIAIPSFQDRVIRSQVEEALSLAAMATTQVDGYYRQTGKLPVDNKSAGLPEPEQIIGNYVRRVEVVRGGVVVTLGNRINRFASDQLVTLRPATVGAPGVPIAWVCGVAPTPQGMTTPKGIPATTLQVRFLPWTCRV